MDLPGFELVRAWIDDPDQAARDLDAASGGWWQGR
jgi:hypothetical protein